MPETQQQLNEQCKRVSAQIKTCMILPGIGEMTVPATSAAAPTRSHRRGTAFLNSYASPSSHIVITCNRSHPSERHRQGTF